MAVGATVINLCMVNSSPGSKMRLQKDSVNSLQSELPRFPHALNREHVSMHLQLSNSAALRAGNGYFSVNCDAEAKSCMALAPSPLWPKGPSSCAWVHRWCVACRISAWNFSPSGSMSSMKSAGTCIWSCANLLGSFFQTRRSEVRR